LLAGVLSMGVVAEAAAFPDLLPYPDISANTLSVSLATTASANILRLSAVTDGGPGDVFVQVDYSDSTPTRAVTDGLFSLSAFIDVSTPSNPFVTSNPADSSDTGSLYIWGNAPDPSSTGTLSPPVLQAKGKINDAVDLTGTGDLKLVFSTVTGGALTSYFPSGLGILLTNTGINAWTNIGLQKYGAAADVRPIRDGQQVPEPGVVALLAVGLLGMVVALRRAPRFAVRA
jgi:hypothetical protein